MSRGQKFKTVSMTIKVTEAQRELLRELSKKDERSISEIVERGTDLYIKEKHPKMERTFRGLKHTL